MRVLVVSQYFWPETFIINDLVRTLVSQGHTVEVLTGKPNYPDGKVFKGYTSDGCMNESFDEGVTVHRIPLYPRGSGGAKNLLRNYFSFVFNGLKYFHRTVKGKSFDVIFCICSVAYNTGYSCYLPEAENEDSSIREGGVLW